MTKLKSITLSLLIFALPMGFVHVAHAAKKHDVAIVANASKHVSKQHTTNKVDLNTVDAKTLAKSVKGIGKKRAEAIVAYRKAHGDFKKVADLANIEINGRALGQKFVQRVAKQLSIG